MHILVAAAVVEATIDILSASFEQEPGGNRDKRGILEDARAAAADIVKDVRDLINIPSVSLIFLLS